MASDRITTQTAGGPKTGLSFDAALIGGSLAIGAMLFIVLLTLQGLFPAAH